jgi:hypothetical protein
MLVFHTSTSLHTAPATWPKRSVVKKAQGEPLSVRIMNTSIKWAAELAHVREVSLHGTADLAFWKDRLRTEDLLLAAKDGEAQLMIVAADSKYMGVRFRELSFSVLVYREENGRRQDGAYLVRAFNSCRFFAFCERVFFATPYYHGDVRVSASLPAAIHLVRKGEVFFRAEMHTDPSGPSREPSRHGEEGWEGPVFLPDSRRGKGLFFARIRGPTRAYPFLPGKDSVMIRPSPGSEVLQVLLDSHFVPKEWVVREDATHAKSKTYKKADVLVLQRWVQRRAIFPEYAVSVQAVHSVQVCAFLCNLRVSVQVVRFYAVARFCAFCASFAFLCNKWGVWFAQQFAQQCGDTRYKEQRAAVW